MDVVSHTLATAEKGNPESVLETIDKWANETGEFLMNVGPKKGLILKEQLEKHKPKRILEIGAFIGYSATLIASNIDDDAQLTSIDVDPDAIKAASSMVKLAGLENKVQFIHAAAKDAIPNLTDPFDLVFLDHLKELYHPDLVLLEEAGLIKEGTVVVADNVGIFADEMPNYFTHVRNSGLYKSETVDASLEYRDDVYDAVEVSIKL